MKKRKIKDYIEFNPSAAQDYFFEKDEDNNTDIFFKNNDINNYDDYAMANFLGFIH